LEALVDLALAEDLTGGDVTTLATVPADARAQAVIAAKEPGVLSGIEAAAFVFRRVDADVHFGVQAGDGAPLAAGAVVATVAGPARSLLAAERVALNLMQRLSGIATLTARYVAALDGTGVQILDTRKTGPGLRVLEKAAVRHGGGRNHRSNLGAGVLIKDNHLAVVGGCGAERVRRAVELARAGAPHTLRIEVEATTLEELAGALEAGADVVLLDNMDVETLRRAVELAAGRALLDASGGITLETVRAVAETGVDLISVGALTHSAPALDLSLEFDRRPSVPPRGPARDIGPTIHDVG
jgi:nicotinate-nucleotide pyrophosphorylase (carboxylating)